MATAAAPRSPRRSSGRPRGADSAARREEILATAARLFSAEGYRGTSMSAVARACGMSQTGLVHHFPTKDDLLQAVMDRRDEIDAARIQSPGDGRPRGWDYLAGLVDLVRHNQGQPGIVRLFTTMAGEAVDPEHPANTWLRRHHRSTAEQIRAALAEAAQDGRLAADAPVDSIARCLIAAMDGLQIQWLSDPDHPDMAEDFAALVDALRHRWEA
ncbi:TetR/AcrR family transcriptional regulator [Kocuria turfanensis]|uniref:TetR/AcrR family transcriptional regulator n=1 Tax=Kocuria turfanensis TaxID=388357 RepID=UPI004035FC4F